MRRVTAVLMTGLLCGQSLISAAEPAAGVLASGIREAIRLGSVDGVPAQGAATHNKRSGHPVLIGSAIGAGVGAVAGYFGTTCAPSAPDDRACGTHYKGGAAFLGGGIGAGVGALMGLAFRR
jgi:hypothetical protein